MNPPLEQFILLLFSPLLCFSRLLRFARNILKRYKKVNG